MYKISDLSFGYGEKKIFEGLNLQIAKDERVVVLGVNGSGKTTLLKLLGALEFAKSGGVEFDAASLSAKALKSREFAFWFRKSVGILFQNVDAMLFNPTVYDEIAFGLRQLEGMDENCIDATVRRWAQCVGVEEHLQSVPFRLSGGEKQRVALASILAVEPKVLLLDEPTSSLDPSTIGWLVDFLDSLAITTVTTTHNLSIANELGSRAVVLAKGGRVVFDGECEKLLGDKQALLDAGLMHIHKHKHDGGVHSHYHVHDW